MFDEPDERSSELAADPKVRAREKADSLSLHAELAAVFEGNRKFDHELHPGLDYGLAREVQQAIGKLEKTKATKTGPLLPPKVTADATALLTMPQARELSTGDYHIHRRPGETMILRWLEAEQVDAFYKRIQAHFDAALNSVREEERSANEWKQEPATLAYLEALDAINLKMADRYLREPIRKHKVFLLSTMTVDEMNIQHLCDYLMGVPAAEVVGSHSAPPDDPTDQDRAWFFKLFSLRGIIDGTERMCFFSYLQKTDDSLDGW